MSKLVCIGIPCYSGVSPETLEDYMRLAYYIGRRCPDYEFLLAIRSKQEQFRARNAIVEAAMQTGCDYLFFLDDDHVIDWEGTPGPNSRYALVEQLINHLDKDPEMGICGALYFQRGAECRPVLMKEGKDGGYYWLRDDEIKHGLQEVAVQGGGCMMIKLSMLDRIPGPWFLPEQGENGANLGTDIQICEKARKAGFKVCCDTSIKIGHVRSSREIITPENRVEVSMNNAKKFAGGYQRQSLDESWMNDSALALYRGDIEEYTGKKMGELVYVADRYDIESFKKNEGNLKEYYKERGMAQLARQLLFHHTPACISQMRMWLRMVNTEVPGRGLDFGCGSAPVGFELVMRGHHIDFVDVDGTAAYEFLKWRAKKRGVEDRCGWKIDGEYDYLMFLDSIEHLPEEEWKAVLTESISRLKDGGALLTNYFINTDYDNPEHISMDKDAVSDFLKSLGVYSVAPTLWVKEDLGFMDAEPEERGFSSERVSAENMCN